MSLDIAVQNIVSQSSVEKPGTKHQMHITYAKYRTKIMEVEKHRKCNVEGTKYRRSEMSNDSIVNDDIS